MEGDKHNGILKATELAGAKTVKTNAVGIALPKEPAKEADFKLLFGKFEESLPRSSKALAYLKQRGLEDFRNAGYNSGKFYNKLKHCLIFPLKDKEGKVCSLYGRRITESNGYNLEYGRHYYSGNRRGLYPCYPNPETEILILTEAIIDAATLLQMPKITSQFTVLSCFGNLAFVKEAREAIKNLPKLQEVIIFFDGDQGGLDGIKHVTEIMQQIRPDVKVTAVETPEKEDVNSLFVKYDKDCLIRLINERKPCEAILSGNNPVNESFSSSENNLIEKKAVHLSAEASAQAGMQNFASPLNTENPHKIIYKTQTARYIVKGDLPLQLDKMLVSLDVQHLETGLKYRCRLDLYEEKQIRKEAREAAEKLDLRSDLIENDLSTLCDLLEEHRENGLETANPKDNDPMPDLPTQAKCKDFLSKPDLINRINELIGKSGITGEYNNRIFLFTLATSYKMPETLHALIQGSSGSGKTHLLGKIADLMPQERVERFTRITDNSLYNYGEYDLQHRLLCLEDVDGLKEEALFAWRELISNNMLRSSTSQKDDNGNSRGAKR
ncbi:MAG: toprim domain-containing protein, partial [Bacteroidota bacterium]